MVTIVRKFKRFISDPYVRFYLCDMMGIYRDMPDEEYLARKFKLRLGYELNLNNPKSFNEKIQWLKLYDRKPEYIMMVDKVLVKDYVAKIIGEEYIIPTIQVWDNPENIDFDSLPSQFVLKCNHNSGKGMTICKDKKILNTRKTIRELKKGLNEDYYVHNREWPYKGVERKVFAEKYIGDGSSDLYDYKFMCFNGVVKCSFVCSNRFSPEGLNVTFYDREWNKMPFERDYKATKQIIPKPANYDLMISLAERISANIPFARIDFYETDNRVYFGEITLYPGSGFEGFQPLEWDYIIGSYLELPRRELK